jgi:hypothetical protein
MSKRAIEFEGNQYQFERAKYACEKSGKNFGATVEKILRNKVGPTSTKKGTKK